MMLWNQLYDAVVVRAGGITEGHAAILQTVARTELACLLLQRRRKEHWDTMSVADSISINKQIVVISCQRDKAIMALGINPGEVDLLGQAFDAPPDYSLEDK